MSNLVDNVNPFEAAQSQDKEVEQAAEHPEKTSQPESKAIYLGNKKFNSVDELAKYTEELERSQLAPTEQPKVAQKKVSELLFEDPDKALELHEQNIIKKLKEEEQIKNAEKQLWDEFYSKNKDLAEDKEIVDFALNRNWEELRRLHPEKAMEKLADYTRQTVMKFRKGAATKQELPSGQAKAGPGTSYSAPQITEKKAAPIDFVTQLKKIQSKRK